MAVHVKGARMVVEYWCVVAMFCNTSTELRVHVCSVFVPYPLYRAYVDFQSYCNSPDVCGCSVGPCCPGE